MSNGPNFWQDVPCGASPIPAGGLVFRFSVVCIVVRYIELVVCSLRRGVAEKNK